MIKAIQSEAKNMRQFNVSEYFMAKSLGFFNTRYTKSRESRFSYTLCIARFDNDTISLLLRINCANAIRTAAVSLVKLALVNPNVCERAWDAH